MAKINHYTNDILPKIYISSLNHNKYINKFICFQAQFLVMTTSTTVTANNYRYNQTECTKYCRGLCAQPSRILKVTTTLHKHYQKLGNNLNFVAINKKMDTRTLFYAFIGKRNLFYKAKILSSAQFAFKHA